MDWIKDPLTHFLMAGALLFVLYSLVTEPVSERNSNRIEITPERMDQLAAGWQAQWRRPPTQQEMQGLVEDFIRQEVLYREAVAMGLDRDDTIIRRRLAQKLEFLAEDLGGQVQPDDAALATWYGENDAAFAEPARLSFRHLYFSFESGDDPAARARAVVEQLSDSQAPADPELGDPFLLEYAYENLDQRQVGALFGTGFAEQIFDLQPEKWSGPVESGYGQHVVQVTHRQEGFTPAFDEVREKVLNEYMRQQRQAANDAVYEQLRARYEVVYPEATGDLSGVHGG